MKKSKLEKEKINEWFNQIPFEKMEEIFKIKQSSFNQEDGYQEFVDYCENYWDSLPIEEKKSIYKEYNF